MLINIGESYAVFNFEGKNQKKLIIKLFSGDEQKNSFTFNSDIKKNILIGR